MNQQIKQEQRTSDGFIWTGIGCDVCGYGTMDPDEHFDPSQPCPECGVTMRSEETEAVLKNATEDAT